MATGTMTTTRAVTASTSPPDVQQLPPPGSYSYTTSGSQTVNGVFSTNYPTSTEISVARTGCGETETWTPTSDNSTQIYVCPAVGGLRVYYEQSTAYGDTLRLNCASNAFIPVTTGTDGEQWHFNCTSSPEGTTAVETVTFKGTDTKTVGSQTVDTVHVEADVTLSGDYSGSSTTEYWFTSNATAVEETGSINITRKSQSAQYASNDTLNLTSLTPS